MPAAPKPAAPSKPNPTASLHPIRKAALQKAETWLRLHASPRLHMLIIVVATGGAALMFSFLLLQLGLESMGWRYAVSTGLGYGVFLLLLRLWLNSVSKEQPFWSGDSHLDAADVLMNIPLDAGPLGEGVGSGTSLAGHAAEGLGLDEAVFLVVALLALLSGAVVCAYVVWTAPVLLAEIFVDGLVMAKIYRKVRIHADSGWTRPAIRRTWVAATLLTAFMAIAGVAMEHLAPGAHSIGAVIDHLRVHP
ncbi:MAG: hypothetical protein ACO34E_01585 [Limisphaerales bacterium]